MDELVQDLASALEQTSEQFKELWEEMLLGPQNRSRQVRQRRGRKRRLESSGHPTKPRPRWMELSESSLEEAPQRFCQHTRSTSTVSVVNFSDSDDKAVANRSLIQCLSGTRLLSWSEPDSLAENNPGHPLKKKRKAKHVSSVRSQKKLKVSGTEWKRSPRPSRVQRPLTLRSNVIRQTDGGKLMGSHCWKKKILTEPAEHRHAAAEIVSESETSSTCNSDTDLFTNDEGRQGDDEQSDWCFEGDLKNSRPKFEASYPITIQEVTTSGAPCELVHHCFGSENT